MFWNIRVGFYLREVTEFQHWELNAIEREFITHFSHIRSDNIPSFFKQSMLAGMWRNVQSLILISGVQNRTEIWQSQLKPHIQSPYGPDIPFLRFQAEAAPSPARACKKATDRSTINKEHAYNQHKGPSLGVWLNNYDAPLKAILFRYFWEKRENSLESNS